MFLFRPLSTDLDRYAPSAIGPDADVKAFANETLTEINHFGHDREQQRGGKFERSWTRPEFQTAHMPAPKD